MKIYQYWENQVTAEGVKTEMPPYYKLCMESLVRNSGCPVEVVTPESVEDLIHEKLPNSVKALYVAQRCDWIRKRLIHVNGGIYLDSDFICTATLKPLLSLAEDLDFFIYKEWGGGLMDNFFGGSKGSVFARKASEIALQHSKRPNIPWLAMSTESLSEAFQETKWEKHVILPTHMIEPVSVVDTQWFTGTLGPAVARTNCWGWMTSYHSLRNRLAGLSELELMSMKNRLGDILQTALPTPQKQTSA